MLPAPRGPQTYRRARWQRARAGVQAPARRHAGQGARTCLAVAAAARRRRVHPGVRVWLMQSGFSRSNACRILRLTLLARYGEENPRWPADARLAATPQAIPGRVGEATPHLVGARYGQRLEALLESLSPLGDASEVDDNAERQRLVSQSPDLIHAPRNVAD
jgi:hypothetical protein